MEREFSVDEANQLLPEVARRVARLQAAHAAVETASRSFGKGGNGTGAGAAAHAAAVEEYAEALKQLAELQIVVRDPSTGIVDFPARREGEPVYLCWQPGEDRVTHWHGRDTGFAGRQPL